MGFTMMIFAGFRRWVVFENLGRWCTAGVFRLGGKWAFFGVNLYLLAYTLYICGLGL